MRHRLPPFIVLGLLAALCVAVIGVVAYVRTGRTSTAALLARLPAEGAVVVSIDFKELRRAGILGMLVSSRISQEPEYRAFVDQTGFDYLNDLDSALVSFHSNATYFLLRGRFDWKNLREYTVNQGGSCYNTVCKVGGSTPDRKISYYPVQQDVMALAVSRYDAAVTDMQAYKQAKAIDIPSEPVWSLIPIAALKNSDKLPAGTRAFVRALDGANTVVLAAGPEGRQIGLRLDATCRTDAEARALVTQLRDLTAQLRELLAREGQAPNPRDLSGILAAGAFDQKKTHVLGRWPIERSFLESLAGSNL